MNQIHLHLTKAWLGVIILGYTLGSSAAPTLLETPSVKTPSIYAWGVQFDFTNAFVTDISALGGRVFYATHTGGRSWNILTVLDGNKSISWDWTNDLGITYYNQGYAIFYYKNGLYDNKGKIYPKSFKSVCLQGQDGFRLEEYNAGNLSLNRLFRTFDGGKSWLAAKSGNVPFDGIVSFDIVTRKMIFACAYTLDVEGRHNKELLEISLDAGKSWKEIYNSGTSMENGVGIRPDHVFFLDERRGWISSDRDDGLFMTTDGGRTWSKIQIPERIVGGIFFKTPNNGRIIGGVSNNIYETVDGGRNWRALHKAETLSESFCDYFAPFPLSRWNDFAVRRTLTPATF